MRASDRLRQTARWATDEELIGVATNALPLLADCLDALDKTIYNPPGWTGPDAWWANETRVLLSRAEGLFGEKEQGAA